MPQLRYHASKRRLVGRYGSDPSTNFEFELDRAIQRCDSTQIGSNIRAYTRIELRVEVTLRMWRVDFCNPKGLIETWRAISRKPYASTVAAIAMRVAGSIKFGFSAILRK